MSLTLTDIKAKVSAHLNDTEIGRASCRERV